MNVPGDVHRTTEVDGLRVVTEHVPGARSVSIGVWIAAGSRHERAAAGGYAHFLEHLLFKGNERIDAEGISRWFDRIGTDANAATTREYTVVHARVLEPHVRESLAVFGEMVFAPALDPGDVDAEREVILEEIAMYEDSPSDVVHELADALVFADHALGRPIVGTSESITTASADALARFHRSGYHPSNVVVSAAGAVDHDAFVELVRSELLSKLRAGGAPARESQRDDELYATSDGAPGIHVPRFELRRKDSEQVHLVLAGRGVSRSDERRHAAALLDLVFGNAPSSRLFLEVRERRGLAYSVYSFLSNHADAGQSGIYVGVRPDRVRTVLEVLHDELERITTTPPSEAELELAKGHVEGRMLLSLESSTVRGNRLGASMVTDMPVEPLARVVERIRSVTREDLLELAQELYDPTALSLAAVAEDIEAVRRDARAAGIVDHVDADAGVRA